MKTNFHLSIVLILLILTSCSQKITDPEVMELKSRQKLLKTTNKLSEIRVSIRETEARYSSLKDQTTENNTRASTSADKAKKLSDEVNSNLGDKGFASNANKASKQAARDARKAQQLNKDLYNTSGKLDDLHKKEKNILEELSKMERKIEFAPREAVNN